MNLLRKIIENIRENIAEYYTLVTIVIAIPLVLTLLTDYRWGLLLSFVAQTFIGILYLRNTSENTK